MSNTIKYSEGSESLALNKGNWWIGTGDSNKGPTVESGYWNAINPPDGGYTVYLNKETNGPSIHSITSDENLISFTNKISGNNYTTVSECLVYYQTQDDKLCVNREIENIVTDGLVLNLDAGYVPSYPTSGTTWYDLSGNDNNGSLVNGPTYSGGSMVFDGVNDFCAVPNQSFNSSGDSSFTIEIVFKRNTITPGNADSLYKIGIGGSTDVRIYFWFDNNSNGQMSINYYAGSGYDRYIQLSPQTIDTNFHHAVQIIDKSVNQMTGYWDGVNKGSGSILAGSYTSDTTLNICGTNYCDASVGFIRIYNRALTPQEVLQNYNAIKGRFGL